MNDDFECVAVFSVVYLQAWCKSPLVILSSKMKAKEI